MIPDIETRKKHTELIVEKTSEYLNKITNNGNISGNIVLMLHWSIVSISMLYLVVGKINIYFYLSMAFWFIIMILHLYFHGCICIKIERNLWNKKDWKGPWGYLIKILEMMNVEITNKLLNNIFNCWGILFTMFILLKIIYNM
jgi:hypothetical protein